jgi:hypothetical protein
MENLIAWLEKQIEGCNDLGGMEKEKWAFIQTLKKVRKEQLTIHSVVGQSEQLVCDVCGSTDVIEAPHMGRNCNRCHPL